MIIGIAFKDGSRYFTNGETLTELKHRVEAGEEIVVWWYTTEGSRNKETFLFPDDGDAVSYYRTESDASPLEEM